jgi:hypothetical protein
MLISELTIPELEKEIHRNFNIKVSGRNYVGKRLRELVKPRRLREIIRDDKLVYKMLKAAIESPDDVFVRKLRRGLEIKIYTK